MDFDDDSAAPPPAPRRRPGIDSSDDGGPPMVTPPTTKTLTDTTNMLFDAPPTPTTTNQQQQTEASIKTSNHVYILDSKTSWIPARVLETNLSTGKALVSIPRYKDEQSIQSDGGRTAKRFEKVTISLKDYPNSALPLQNVDEDGRLKVVNDMVDLPCLHEAAILYNIKSRHLKSLPYTRTGDIVIAVNPYKWIHHLYDQKCRSQYAKALVWDRSVGNKEGAHDPRSLLEPHVYEASSLAYRGLAMEGEDQSILVSGESGAGKTETVKILMGDIASVQRGPETYSKNKKKNVEKTESNKIVQRVLDSNPLLEAFGNAKTIRNDNSSRFGKYIQLQFDTPQDQRIVSLYSSSQGGGGGGGGGSNMAPPKCNLVGSKCEVYLLEKSRVISHEPGERTFHIFYQLLAAPDAIKTHIWDGLEDTDIESFDYVGWTETQSIEGMSDAERFQHTIDSLEMIGLDQHSLRTLFRAICIVLQLGNIDYGALDEDRAEITSEDELESLSSLMGIPQDVLTTALLMRNVEARSETFQVPLNADFAKDSTDAFAKEIYAKTFLWLVRTINDATCAEKNHHGDGKYPVRREKYGIIGLLDIFGFESFEVNRFEQLCINYANEKLQQKFTQDIFRSVQTEYEFEGIELGEITYDDNTDVLDLVEGRMGLLAFLNEECVRPKGSDKTFVYKVQAMNKDNPCFSRPKHSGDCEFGITHYAGHVVYDATNFVTKNMDTLPKDLQECSKKSTNAILAKELCNEDMMNSLAASSDSTAAAGTTTKPPEKKKKRRAKAANPNAPSNNTNAQLKRGKSNIAGDTVWTKFKNQLSSLMARLNDTRTRYIRCIKPNKQKKALIMQHTSTVEQLRCAGVVAAVTISRSAFPNRLDHEVVLDRFKSLWPKGAHHMEKIIKDQDSFNDDDSDENSFNPTRKAVEMLLSLALKEMEYTNKKGVVVRAFVLGKSRAYFRAGALEFLESERLKYLSKWATEIQRAMRGYVCRSKFHKIKRLALCLQCYARCRHAKRAYQKIRNASIRVQCWIRVLEAKHLLIYLRRKYRSTKIQTRWRIFVARRRLLECVSASIVIQTMVRGSLQRPKYRQALIDKKEEMKLENQLRTLQRKLEEAENKRIEAEKAAEERAAAALKKLRDEEEAAAKADAAAKAAAAAAAEEKKAEEAAAAAAREEAARKEHEKEEKVRLQQQLEEQKQEQHKIQQQLTAEQQTLMDESGKMLEYLRKEVFKLRSTNTQLRTDFDLLKDNNQRLMDANASAGASFAALNQHAKQLSKQNVKLQTDITTMKTHTQKLNVLQVELKEELKMKQATYIAEVHSRLQYQRALTRITDLIQENCRDHRLVEGVLEIADECEMEYMSGTAQGGGGGGNPTTSTGSNGTSQPKHAIDDEEDEREEYGESRSSILGFVTKFF